MKQSEIYPPICGIYMIINTITGHQYVGQSIDIWRRYRQHFSTKSHGTPELHRDLEQIGMDNAVLIVLEECDREQLNERENYYIKFFEPEYNKSLGQGRLGLKNSERTRKIISKKVLERWNSMSKEEQKTIIERMKECHPVGYHHSEETKKKIADKRRGTKRSAESIQHQKETMQKKKDNGYVRESRGAWIPVVCTTTGEEFESVKAAAKYFGIYGSNISAVLKGIQNTTHGLRFAYKEEKDGNNR